MEIIEVKQQGDIYSCDIGITKGEWLEVLQDEKTMVEYKETLLRFYYYPDHRGSCTAVSNTMGGSPRSLNSYIAKIGEYVQKRLGRFQVIRPNGKPCYWIIPMCEGMDLPKGSEGTFEWQLRSELVEAIRDYLYWYLVERYKELRREVPIDGDKWTEIYKWQMITANKGKSPIDIIRSHVANPKKSELGGFDNLVDAARDNKPLLHLVKTNPEGLQGALNSLTNENKPLNERLASYKSTMSSLLSSTEFNSKANDERLASVILTCINPQKYTIYKYEVYVQLCKYLNEEKRPAGQCYEHFLEMLRPLRELIDEDISLQQLVSHSLHGQENSALLLAQDVLWMLFVEFPSKIGYIHDILFPNKQRVWLWSLKVSKSWQDTLDIGSSAKNIKDFRPYKSRNALRKAYQQDVGNSDLKIPDAYWSFINEVSVGDIVVSFEPKKGNGKQYHMLHGWGIITSDCMFKEENDNPMCRTVQWHSILEIPKQNEEMGNSLFFQGTTDKQALHIKELLNINTETEMNSEYQIYIDLLMANKNLILTGAPGTGKTFMAKEIAKAMGCKDEEIGFVQFHPSYDYTDFVEGLRPTKPDINGSIGFRREDGVFKEFCKSALLHEDANTQKTIENALTAFKKDLLENGDKKIKSFRSSTIIQTTLDKRGNIAVAHISSPWSVTDDKMMDYLQKGACHENDTYTKSIGDYIKKNYCHPTDNGEIKPLVFIIDEINRGEISKIFGELFFSIDPGYRGEEGKVQTQYQNMVEDGDVFKDGFFVPENVYIIGTMNDIDRSVESMDFAMRRRFAWAEVSAEESMHMLDGMLNEKALKNRMRNLNEAILRTNGLGKAYQIGAAYFKKYEQYNNFEALWQFHLEGLLAEYLRGSANAEKELANLKKAYEDESTKNVAANSNQG